MLGVLGAEVQPFLIPYSYSSAVFTSEAYVKVVEVFKEKSNFWDPCIIIINKPPWA
jgi:hypothetical protein